MSKVVKGIVIGAIIGFATGGLGILAGQAFGITAMAGASLKAAILYGAISGAVSGAAAMFIKKPNMDMGSAIQRQNLSIDPQALGMWVFGETPCDMSIVYSERVGDDQIVHVVASAAHEIDSFGDFYVNDEKITFAGNAATGSWSGALYRFTNLGTQTQAPLSIPGSAWGGNSAGLGIAHIGLKWDAGNDPNGKLEGGIPTRITQVVKGSKVYDPRLDDTKGGSGTHRADDQSTWEWSDNWALIVAHYLLGYRNNDKLVYGVGINPDDIDWLQVAAMANVCDETVDDKPRYRVGGVIATSNDHSSVISQLEASIGGKVSKVGGKYYIWCPHDDLISQGTITNNKILREVGITFSPTGNIADLFNTSRGRYIEPGTLYQPTPYAEIVENTAVTEDGRTRLMERDFSIVQDESIAERVAREMVRRSRFSATWTFAMGPEGLLYQPFDVVTLNCDETDFNDELVRIISMEYSPDGIVAMTVVEEDASIYDVTLPLGIPVTQLDPNSYDPSQSIAVTGLTASPTSVIGSGGTVSDAFNVSWNNPGGFVRDTEVRYRVVGDPEYSYVQGTGFLSAVITPVEPNTQYDIGARHITIENVKSDWVDITATSSDTSRGRSISGFVDYSQVNTWRWDSTEQTILPTSTTNDATFIFRRGSFQVATRTVRATIDPVTGNIAINSNFSTSGETTSVTVSGAGTKAVVVRVLHDSSGVEVPAQFLTLETTAVDLEPILVDISELQDDLDTLENTTLPALQQELDDILPITETDISDNAISTPKLQANSIVAGKIAADAVTTNSIAAGSIISSKIGAGEIKAINIEAGAVTANKIDVGTLSAISTNTGTLTSNLIRTAASGQRLEITDPGTDPTYALWIGNGTKNDGNSVFHVKHDGSSFISKDDFDISDGGITTGAFSNAGTSLAGQGSNTLQAPSGPITVGAGGVSFEVNLFYQAARNTNQTSAQACFTPNVSGEIRLQRAQNASFTLGLATVNTLSFSANGTRTHIPDDEPGIAPGFCFTGISFDNIKSFVDTPAPGTYYYRLLYASWLSPYTSGEVTENVIYSTFVASGA